MVESGAAAVRSDTGALGALAINLFDGSRKPFTGGAVLVNVRDGNQKQGLRQDFTTPSIRVKDLTVFHNQGDNYAVVVSSPGYKDAGFYPVKIKAGQTRSVDLMLIPSVSSFNFFRAKWNALASSDVALKTLLGAGANDDGAASTSTAKSWKQAAELFLRACSTWLLRIPRRTCCSRCSSTASGSLSDPKHVYVLRWIAGRQAGVPEFDPLYTIEKA
jgi:hypothetical protein